MSLPSLPSMPRLGTTSSLAKAIEKGAQDKLNTVKVKARETKLNREAEGLGEKSYKEQINIPPPFESNENRHVDMKKMKKGFKIEVVFGYIGEDGSKNLGWYQGEVIEILNVEKRSVQVEWCSDCIGAVDRRVSNVVLAPRNWNPKVVRKNGWRENLS